MRWLFQPLLNPIAFCPNSEPIRQVQYLRVENQILRKTLSKRLFADPRRDGRIRESAMLSPSQINGPSTSNAMDPSSARKDSEDCCVRIIEKRLRNTRMNIFTLRGFFDRILLIS